MREENICVISNSLISILNKEPRELYDKGRAKTICLKEKNNVM